MQMDIFIEFAFVV